MHFIAIVQWAAVLHAIAAQPLRDAVAGRQTLEVVGGLAQQRDRGRGTDRCVLHLGPDNAETLPVAQNRTDNGQ